jgi:hypothetical protein
MGGGEGRRAQVGRQFCGGWQIPQGSHLQAAIIYAALVRIAFDGFSDGRS